MTSPAPYTPGATAIAQAATDAANGVGSTIGGAISSAVGSAGGGIADAVGITSAVDGINAAVMSVEARVADGMNVLLNWLFYILIIAAGGTAMVFGVMCVMKATPGGNKVIGAATTAIGLIK